MKLPEIEQAWQGVEKCRRCAIRSLVLFADLQREDFDHIHLPIEEMELTAGQSLYQSNQQGRYVFTIRQGLIKLTHPLANGHYRVIRLLRQGDLAGIEALNGARYLHHAEALQSTLICRIPIENIESLNSNTPHLYQQLTRRWHQIQQDADTWLAKFAQGGSRQRLAHLLLYLAEAESQPAFFLPGREDIGAMLGITTETASRLIADFRRSGFLHTGNGLASIEQDSLESIIAQG